MNRIEVSARVWDHLLTLRKGEPPREAQRSLPFTEAESAALALYEPLARRDDTGYVLAQIGQSLDGRVAAQNDDARVISGPDGLAHLHRLRALTDAVLIGVNTALHDKPRLTVRLAEGPNPARVIIDPGGRLPNAAPVLAADGVRRIVIQSVDKPRPEGVEVIQLPRAEWISARAILTALRGRGLRALLVEGGGITIARFLEAGALTRLHVSVAPLLIGAGPQGLTTRPLPCLAEAPRPETAVYGLGSDVLFDCAFAPPSAAAEGRSLPLAQAGGGSSRA